MNPRSAGNKTLASLRRNIALLLLLSAPAHPVTTSGAIRDGVCHPGQPLPSACLSRLADHDAPTETGQIAAHLPLLRPKLILPKVLTPTGACPELTSTSNRRRAETGVPGCG